MRELPVHRIIPFSNVEGRGNRTSIFVQGCNANCLYCHNSETIPMTSQDAKLYGVDELVKIIKENMPFIRGITVSGGEATIYHDFLAELFDEIHKLGLTCYVDTNGFFDINAMAKLVESTDKFLYDVKGIGNELEALCFSEALLDNNHLFKDYGKRMVSNNEHLTNLSQLLSMDKIEEVRLVYLKGYNHKEIVIKEIANILSDYPDIPLKLIRMHVRGLPKERLLLLKGAVPDLEEFKSLSDMAKDYGIQNIIELA